MSCAIFQATRVVLCVCDRWFRHCLQLKIKPAKTDGRQQLIDTTFWIHINNPVLAANTFSVRTVRCSSGWASTYWRRRSCLLPLSECKTQTEHASFEGGFRCWCSVGDFWEHYGFIGLGRGIVPPRTHKGERLVWFQNCPWRYQIYLLKKRRKKNQVAPLFT